MQGRRDAGLLSLDERRDTWGNPYFWLAYRRSRSRGAGGHRPVGDRIGPHLGDAAVDGSEPSGRAWTRRARRWAAAELSRIAYRREPCVYEFGANALSATRPTQTGPPAYTIYVYDHA